MMIAVAQGDEWPVEGEVVAGGLLHQPAVTERVAPQRGHLFGATEPQEGLWNTLAASASRSPGVLPFRPWQTRSRRAATLAGGQTRT